LLDHRLCRDVPRRGEDPRLPNGPGKDHLGANAGRIADSPIHGEEAGFQVAVIQQVVGNAQLFAILETPGADANDDQVPFLRAELEARRKVVCQKLAGRNRSPITRKRRFVQETEIF